MINCRVNVGNCCHSKFHVEKNLRSGKSESSSNWNNVFETQGKNLGV